MDDLQKSNRNVFVDWRFKRRPDSLDAGTLAELSQHPDSRYLVFCQGKVLLSSDEPPMVAYLSGSDIGAPVMLSSLILIDEDPRPVFALEITSPYHHESVLRSGGRFVGLRDAALSLDATQASYVAAAKALLHWQHTHRFCGACGHTNELIEGGHVMKCGHVECARISFPRTDPAIIALIEHEQSCLLARQSGWPKNRYSCIAGFVEPGESLETAVRREAFEETGVDITAVSYHSSQPWPFPQSVMLGFHAACQNRKLTLWDGELEDARWYRRDEVFEALKSGDLRLPSDISISFRLLEDWYDQEADISLQSVLASLKRGH